MSDSTRFVFDFRPGRAEGDPSDVERLGAKGAGLAALCRAGLPVPPGFTISAECCAWIERHGEWPAGLRDEAREGILRLEQETRRGFGRGAPPLLVAVRCGAAQSMPGMLDTILWCGLHPGLRSSYPDPRDFWRDYAEHLRMLSESHEPSRRSSPRGRRPPDELTGDDEAQARWWLDQWRQRTGHPFPEQPWEAFWTALGAAFASWNSPRARAFRRRHSLPPGLGAAITVQAMFPAQKAGVLFTANPADPAASEWLLEATARTGTAVVSGAATPDSDAFERASLRRIRSTRGGRVDEPIASEPILADGPLAELAKLGREVERLWRRPVDIEWAWNEGQFALLQARPIRGLDVAADLAIARREEVERLRRSAGSQRVVWVAHNLSETLVAPTPLTWDSITWLMSGRGGYGQLYRWLGFEPAAETLDHSFLELIGGRIFVDPRRAARFYRGSAPFQYDVDELLTNPRAIDLPPRQLDLDSADPWLFARLPKLLWRMWGAWRASRQLAAESPQRFDEFMAQDLQSYLEETSEQRLDRFDEGGLIVEFARRREWVLGPLAAECLLPGYCGGLALARLTERFTQLLGPGEAEALAAELTTGLPGEVASEQNLALDAVARDEQPLPRFLARFGHRAAQELELAEPRWIEDSSGLEDMLERLRNRCGTRPADRHADAVARRVDAELALPQRLADAGGSFLRERILADLAEAQRLLPYRELGKFHLLRGYFTLRAPLLELARRWELGNDLFFLRFDELPRYRAEASELRGQIAARKLRRESSRRLRWGTRIDSLDLDRLAVGDLPPPTLEAARQAPARRLAPGSASGRAMVVDDERPVDDLPDSYILVCPSADPHWAPLIFGAAGMIVERGGLLSHVAIVARDLGLPLAALDDATRLIPPGAHVEIDGAAEIVRWREGD